MKRGYKYLKQAAGFILILLLIMQAVIISANAQESEQKVVRVGWYESAFHRTDQFGRRSGYGYEYQQRIAIYTGWNYEYVEGSWSELLEKLIAGEIDLLSDVSFTREREGKILYSSEAMGAESYHLFISPENNGIRPDDYSSLNGKRVGINKNSIQEQMFIDWAKIHNVTPEIIESTEKSPAQMEMLARGEFDALVTLDTYGNYADVVPVWKIGYAESFFGINKNRPDLKRELDVAMSRLLEDNRDFNQRLTDKYNRAGSVNSFLTTEEKAWLSAHGTIKVGYRDNFLPFSDFDEQKQVLTGTLADYLSFGETCEKNAEISFQTRPFSTTEEALQAMAAGEIDCVFPLSLSSYDGEQRNVIITDPLVSTEMYAIVRTADHQGISPDNEMTAAVVKGNPNYETFLMDFFPNWQIAYYDDSQAVFQAVLSGKADCGLVSNYRINLLTDLFKKYEVSVLATGKVMDMPFAVSHGNRYLYSILNKITRLIPETSINSSLTNYGYNDNKITFWEYIKDNWIYFIAAAAVVAVVFLLLVLRNLWSERKLAEGRQIISEAERDHLTNLYNRNFFYVYANRLNRERRDTPMDAVVMNIDRFHSINALYGRDFGDRVLRTMGEAIQNFLNENDGIASRFDADRFDIYCSHIEDWQTIFEQFRKYLDELPHGANIHLRMGVKPWEPGMEPVTQFDKARIACNKIRGDFKAQVMVFDDDMEQREDRDQRLLNDLGRALELNEIVIHYQPKYNIREEKPKLSSAEALARWNHPDLGLIRPDEFIPLFEQSGQITDLDKFVWNQAARQIARWKSEFGVTLPISVNLSRMDIFDSNLISTLDGIIKKNGLTGKDLKLEVTESAYTENADQLITVIEQLRSRGYEIEMDDFGSGFSSLNMLSSMPIDVLKMDIAFIRNIERNEKDFRLVELIIDIASYLKVPVIAEGVETEKQLTLLKNAGCDLVQGYYFSQPLPPEEFEQKILGIVKQ